MRLELFFRMGKAPPLGSIQDLVLRNYLEKSLQKEFLVNKLSIMASLGNQDVAKINSDLQTYVNMQFFLDSHNEDIDKRMKAQYDLIKNTTPRLYKDKHGNAKVTGLVSHLE
mgnify:FL=1